MLTDDYHTVVSIRYKKISKHYLRPVLYTRITVQYVAFININFLCLLVCFVILQRQTLTNEQSPTTSIGFPSLSPTAPPPKRKEQLSQDSTQKLVGLAAAYFKQSKSKSETVTRRWSIKLRKSCFLCIICKLKRSSKFPK